MKDLKFNNPQVENAFNAFSDEVRDKLLILRAQILEIAEESHEIGEIEETLKWGEPSYLTHRPKSGTTIRLSNIRSHDDKFAISVHCQTSLVSEFKDMYPALEFDGNRSVIFEVNNELPLETTKHFIASALTYHLRQRAGTRSQSA